MKPSLLAIVVSVTVVGAQANLRAEDYFTRNLQVALTSDNAANTPSQHRDFLLPYHEEDWPKKYLDWLWKDPVNLLTRPAFWGGSQWATFGIEAGITGALMPADRSFRDFSDDIRYKPVTQTLKSIDYWYGNYPLAFYSGGMFAGGLIFKNEKLADSGFLSAESIGYASLLDVAIKNVFGRERPRVTKDQYQFLGPGSSSGNSSFVSGDTIAAFAFASSVSEVWQNPWITWPLYALATAVAFQRTQVDAHWLSDVVGAAFLGHAIGKTIVHMHYRHDTIDGRLMPYVTDHVVGLQFAFQF